MDGILFFYGHVTPLSHSQCIAKGLLSLLLFFKQNNNSEDLYTYYDMQWQNNHSEDLYTYITVLQVDNV